MNAVILASTSPYRKNLLERIGLKVTAIAPVCDEKKFQESTPKPRELALLLSQIKARSVATNYPQQCVIGGDQVAAVEQRILNKPETVRKAHEQLQILSDKTHHLYTAITIIFQGKEYSFVDDTALTMRPLTHEEIDNYIDQDSPLDCAGSYKIESLGLNLFDQIVSEDHTAIIGIPLLKLAKQLRQLGINPLKKAPPLNY